MSSKQIQYFRQYGIKEKNYSKKSKMSKKRKMIDQESEQNKKKIILNSTIYI